MNWCISLLTIRYLLYLKNVVELFSVCCVVFGLWLFLSLSFWVCLISFMSERFLKGLITFRCYFSFKVPAIWNTVVGPGWGLLAAGLSHRKPKMTEKPPDVSISVLSLWLVSSEINPSVPRVTEASLLKLCCPAEKGCLLQFGSGTLLSVLYPLLCSRSRIFFASISPESTPYTRVSSISILTLDGHYKLYSH